MIQLLRGGHAPEAIAHLRDSMRLGNAWPESVNALAWLLATSPDPSVRSPEEALALAHQAVAMTGGNDARVLDTFAAAQAANGQFGPARQSALRAMALADSTHATAILPGMRERLRHYERSEPWREPAASSTTSP